MRIHPDAQRLIAAAIAFMGVFKAFDWLTIEQAKSISEFLAAIAALWVPIQPSSK